MKWRKRMRAKTGGHWFVKILQQKGVQFVFGTTGSGMVDIQDAMVVTKPPKWIQGLHELTTVSAATGYALSSGNPGVALVDRVVGTQNMLGALHCAYLTSSPTVVFASRDLPGVSGAGGVTPFHYHSAQARMVEPWTKWSAELARVENLPEDVERAIQMATTEPRGPTYVTLRQDAMVRRVSNCESIVSDQEQVAARLPDDSTVRRIVDEVLAHSSPQVVVSHAGRRPESVPALVEFAHLLGVGVRDRRVFMNYPINDALHCGFVTWGRPLHPATDLAIALEAGMLPHEHYGEKVDLIDLMSDSSHRQDVSVGGDYGGTPIPALVRAECDVAPTIQKIVKLARRRISKKDREVIADRTARTEEWHERRFGEARKRAKKSFDSGRLDFWSIGHVLNKNWPMNAIWADGSWKETLCETIELKRPGTYFSNPSGHLGVSVGMAYGIALARGRYVDVRSTERYAIGRIERSPYPVICTVGDGDAIQGNLDSALWTCRHYGIGVLYIVFNNASWGVEWPFFKRTTMKWAVRAADFEFVDIDRPRIDFREIARGFDVHAERIETPDELDRALRESIPRVGGGHPCLLDIQIEKGTGRAESSVP